MVKRIVGMLVGAFLGFMVQAVLIPDVNPLICMIRLRERAAEEMRSGYLCLNVVYAQVSALQ